MNSGPLISICIPTYNNAKYIGDTIKSILNQSYNNLEIIIVDNASQEDIRGLAASFGDSRIKYVRFDQKVKSVANWNRGIKLATADIVAVYHSDDIYAPDIVEKEYNFLHNNPDCGAVFCLDKVIDTEGRSIGNGVKIQDAFRNTPLLDFPALFNAFLSGSNSFLVAPTFMARKKVFESVGFFDESDELGCSNGTAADVDMWLRISQQYTIGVIKGRLINRRVTFTQGSTQYETSRTSRGNHFTVLDRFLEHNRTFSVSRSVLNQYSFNKFWDNTIIAQNLINQGNKQGALSILRSNYSFSVFWRCPKILANLIKSILYSVLLVSLAIGFPSIGIFVLDFVKRIYARI